MSFARVWYGSCIIQDMVETLPASITRSERYGDSIIECMAR
jgi:hypothetical protein